MILDTTGYSNPQSQALFQDPFVVFLETFEKELKYARNSLLQDLNKILGTTIKKQVRCEWPFYFFSTLKELNKYHSWNHLLDWLYWKREFTK